jgi:hypothetical protein
MLDLGIFFFPSLSSDTGMHEIISGVEPKLPMQDWVGALFTVVVCIQTQCLQVDLCTLPCRFLRIVTDHITRPSQ